MAAITKILGQEAPGAVLTDLYTVPNGGQTTVTVNVCNTGIFAESYRIAIAPGGAADDIKQYIAYDVTITANDNVTVGSITVRASDVVRVYASSGNVAFTAMGVENV